MISLERLITGLSALTLTLAAMTVVTLGVAGAMLCAFVTDITATEAEFWWEPVRTFTCKLGITFLLIGFAVFLLWPKPRSKNKSELHRAEGTWRDMFVFSLLLLPLLVLAASGPLLSLWSEALGLMERWGVWDALWQSSKQQFGGVVFVPIVASIGLALLVPLLEAATLGAFLGGSAFPLLLLRFKSQSFYKVFIIWVLMQAAFLAGSFYAVDLMSQLTPLFLNKVSEFGTQPSGDPGPDVVVLAGWVRRHDQVVGPTAYRFAWVFVGYVISALMLLTSGAWSGRRSNC